MKRLGNCVMALLFGCRMPLLIWTGVGVALYHRRKDTNLLSRALLNLACFIDADCPPGYVCFNGRCVPHES